MSFLFWFFDCEPWVCSIGVAEGVKYHGELGVFVVWMANGRLWFWIKVIVSVSHHLWDMLWIWTWYWCCWVLSWFYRMVFWFILLSTCYWQSMWSVCSNFCRCSWSYITSFHLRQLRPYPAYVFFKHVSLVLLGCDGVTIGPYFQGHCSLLVLLDWWWARERPYLVSGLCHA